LARGSHLHSNVLCRETENAPVVFADELNTVTAFRFSNDYESRAEFQLTASSSFERARRDRALERLLCGSEKHPNATITEASSTARAARMSSLRVFGGFEAKCYRNFYVMLNASASRLRSAQHLLSRFARVAVEEVSRVKPRKIAAEVAATLLPQQTFNRTRTAVLRAAGVRIGKHSLVLGAVRLTGDGDLCGQLTIGSNTIITGPIHADLGASITIGDRVQIGHNVSLLTISHEIGDQWQRTGYNTAAPIEVGDGVWLASHVTVLGGVKIGAGSVVAAGAMVTRDVPPNTLVAGIPAKVQKHLPVRDG